MTLNWKATNSANGKHMSSKRIYHSRIFFLFICISIVGISPSSYAAGKKTIDVKKKNVSVTYSNKEIDIETIKLPSNFGGNDIKVIYNHFAHPKNIVITKDQFETK